MLNIVILAAGLGKRMQSDLPKVLHRIAGKPMLSHVLDQARQLEPDQIIVVTGHGAERVQAAFEGQPDIAFALQRPQQGTGHAVQQALPALVGGEQAGDATLVLYGDVRSDSGDVLRIVEHKDASDAERAINEVNTGILAAPTAKLREWLGRITNDNAQGEYYLTDIVALAVEDGIAVRAAQPVAPWETLGVNSRLQQAQLERAWQQEQARRLLEQGVTLADPSRFDLRGELVCGRDVFIDVGCVFEGRVELADGVHIGPHCVVRDAVIGAGTRIDAYTHIDDAKVAGDARLGPYARLRPGADIGPSAHVGNFVEIKKSVLGEGSKANHLAYIGDAQIGARVNIGAGTITCNYDGVNKHRTIIEDDAFIGSDTQLVAPVIVGRGATLGAGTTLTRDAPADRLTLTRVAQTTSEKWRRPQKKS